MKAQEVVDSMPQKQYGTRRAFVLALRRELKSRGLPFGRATYDAAGNCRVCGESGRCPGLHTLDEIPTNRRRVFCATPDNSSSRILESMAPFKLSMADSLDIPGRIIIIAPCEGIGMRTGTAFNLGDIIAGDFHSRAAPGILPSQVVMAGGCGPSLSMVKKCRSVDCCEPSIKDGLCRGHLQACRLDAAIHDLEKRAAAARIPIPTRVCP